MWGVRAGRDYRDHKQMHCFFTERGMDEEEKKEYVSIQMLHNYKTSSYENESSVNHELAHTSQRSAVRLTSVHVTAPA